MWGLYFGKFENFEIVIVEYEIKYIKVRILSFFKQEFLFNCMGYNFVFQL